MRKGTIGAIKIGGSVALFLVAVIFSIYFVIPALAAHGDSNGPQFFFNATSNTSYQYQPGSNYGFQVNITNETGVYGTIGNITFELGRPSGTLTNYTNYSSILVQNYTNLSFINFTQEQLGPAGTYNYTWYANDTAPASGKWNKTQTVAFTVSANSTTPVLNFPTPANASYIYGTSAQLFQINITDASKATANNATLYYKVNTTDTWSTAATYCFYGTPNYVCNTTVNIAGSYLENDKIQYFFNMSDANYTGIGTNGTAASPLSTVIDQTPPRSSNVGTNDTDNIIAKDSGINLSVRWTDNYGLNNATLSINVSGTEVGWRNITNAFGSPLTLSGAADWSNFTFSNSSLVAGTVVQWKVYVNDQVLPTRNENVSAQGEFTIDGTAPTASGNVTSLANGTTYNTANNYGFQINWTDTVAVSNVTFDLGRPDGTKTNYTNATTLGVVKMGDTYYVNLTQHQLGPAGTYNFTWLANDTSNNFRWDSIMPYVIVPAAAPVVTLQLNGTEGNRTYNKSDVINQSATSSISGLTVTLYNNMSGTLAAIGNNISTINVTNVTTSLTLGTYRVLANVTSNENYTANVTGVTYFITLTDGIAPTMRIFNATSGAQLFNNTRVTNGTSLSLNITVSDNDVFSNSFNASVYIGTTFAGNITNVSVNAANGTITIPNGLANGNLTLNVSITDASGNAAYNTTFTVDVDNIAPVLRYVTPADNSYITGSSAELFQTNVTEANLDSTKNVTLNYKRQGIALWTQAALACYDAAGTKALASGPFKCNTTVNLEGFGSGWLIQYYFNTTDLAGNTGNNGTATNWLNTTIDRTNPQFIANASSPATYQNYSTSANYGFQINWTNTGGIDKVLFQLGRPTTGLYTNYTASLAGGFANTYIANFTQAAFGPSGIYNITWFANDTAGNANATQTWNYQIYNATNVLNLYLINSTATYTNQNIVVTYGSSVTLNASATMGTVYLYRNASQRGTGSAAVENATETVTLGAGVWEINASVTSNNANYSDNTTNITYYVIVNQASITSYLNLQINGTGSDSIRAYPNVTNVTGWSNVTGQTNLLFALYRNSANITLNASSADYNRTETNLLGVGNYTYIYNTTGNANYTSGSITRSLNITKGTPTLGLHINDTSGNQNYIYTIVTRITANNSDVANYDGVYELFRNNTNLTGSGNNTNVTLAAGVYLFIHNVTAGTNYTSGTTSVYLTINKAATSMQVWLNGTAAASATYNRTQVMNFTAVLNVSGKTIYLDSNYSVGWINQSATPLENLTTLNTIGTYNFTAYFNADENYTASANYTTITVNDVSLPISTANATSLASGSAYSTSANYGFQINWTDDVAVFNATFQLGRPGGTLNNYTNSSGSTPAVRLTGSTYHINFTQDQFGPAGTYNITWLANDTSNNWNKTDIILYTIIPAATNTTLWINSFAANTTNIEQGNNVNLTATLNITGTVYIYANLTGWVLLSNSTGTLTNTTSSSGVTPRNFSNITAYFAGNENYSASSQYFHINVTADTTGPTILLFNGSSQPFLNASVTKKGGSTFAVNASVSDTGVGVTGQTCIAYVNGTSSGTGTVSNGFCNMTVTMPSSGSGNVTLNITVNDTNNNIGFNSSFVVQMDNTAPVLTIITPSSGQYVKGTLLWVNGSVSDNIAMGTANISVNNSAFSNIIIFNGNNNTAFNITNSSTVADGYVAINVGYVDLGGTNGNATIAFYADNTPPSASVGLTNSTAGTKYAPTTSQTIQVSVTDNLQTNATITLHYKLPLRDYWNTTISGAPGSSTVYSGTIDTSELVTHQNVSYYITGVDNATNLIASGVGGNASSPLGRITIEINTTGSIDGYIIKNGTSVAVSGATVSDGVRAAVTNTNGYYLISNVPAGTYTVTSSATDYITNSTAGVSVSNGATARVNITMSYNASGIIQGYVKSNDTTPALLPSAIISDGTRTVASGANGFYQITGVAPGTYSLNVSKTDYISNSTIGIAVTAGGTANINLTMAPNDSTAPTISFAAPTNLTNVTTTTPTITFSVEENVADNIRDISVSGVNGFSKTGNYTGGNAWKGTYSFKPTALTNGQNYTISVTATNKVGLSSTSSIIVEVDTTKGVTASLISSDTSGVADNNYANGWSYTFNITLGTGVNGTRVKLDNFTMATDSTKTIGVPGNVIMNYTNASGYAKSYNVLESYNESAIIDPLFDLDSSAAGVQGNVTIYVKIPSGTVAGAYSTAYTFGSYTV